MPHFIIECSKNITQKVSSKKLLKAVYKEAEASGLFAENDIKARLRYYKKYKLGRHKKSFVHVFGYIMEGRSTEQKQALSRSIVEKLTALAPFSSFISMNIMDFEKATYSNKSLIDPSNEGGDRYHIL